MAGSQTADRKALLCGSSGAWGAALTAHRPLGLKETTAVVIQASTDMSLLCLHDLMVLGIHCIIYSHFIVLF